MDIKNTIDITRSTYNRFKKESYKEFNLSDEDFTHIAEMYSASEQNDFGISMLSIKDFIDIYVKELN